MAETQTLDDATEQLQAYVEIYAGLLKLKDWEIQARFGTLKDVPLDCEAQLHFDRYHSEAEITVLVPEQAEMLHDGPSFHEPDVEKSIVHELVHLRLIDIDKESQRPVDIHEERAINVITGALVSLVREIREQAVEIDRLRAMVAEGEAAKRSKQK